LPLYQPATQARFLEAWLAITIVYFAAGFLMLVAGYRRLAGDTQDDPRLRRRVGALLLALAAFVPIVLHNVFVRNWHSWFGNAPPPLFSWAGFVGEACVFLLIPLTIAYCVLADSPSGRDNEQGAAARIGTTQPYH